MVHIIDKQIFKEKSTLFEKFLYISSEYDRNKRTKQSDDIDLMIPRMIK